MRPYATHHKTRTANRKNITPRSAGYSFDLVTHVAPFVVLEDCQALEQDRGRPTNVVQTRTVSVIILAVISK